MWALPELPVLGASDDGLETWIAVSWPPSAGGPGAVPAVVPADVVAVAPPALVPAGLVPPPDVAGALAVVALLLLSSPPHDASRASPSMAARASRRLGR